MPGTDQSLDFDDLPAATFHVAQAQNAASL